MPINSVRALAVVAVLIAAVVAQAPITDTDLDQFPHDSPIVAQFRANFNTNEVIALLTIDTDTILNSYLTQILLILKSLHEQVHGKQPFYDGALRAAALQWQRWDQHADRDLRELFDNSARYLKQLLASENVNKNEVNGMLKDMTLAISNKYQTSTVSAMVLIANHLLMAETSIAKMASALRLFGRDKNKTLMSQIKSGVNKFMSTGMKDVNSGLWMTLPYVSALTLTAHVMLLSEPQLAQTAVYLRRGRQSSMAPADIYAVVDQLLSPDYSFTFVAFHDKLRNIGGLDLDRTALAMAPICKRRQQILSQYKHLNEVMPYGEPTPEHLAALKEASGMTMEQNRYKDIIAGVNSRIPLQKENMNGSTYINADSVKGYNSDHVDYILTQAPKPETIADFYQMLWEQKTDLIVMLTRLEENRREKATKYWDKKTFTNGMEISCLREEEPLSGVILRTIEMRWNGASRAVQQLHYTGWPDFGTPSMKSFKAMFNLYRGLRHDIRSKSQGSPSPIVIHCSAGVGRAGTFASIDITLNTYEECQGDRVQHLATFPHLPKASSSADTESLITNIYHIVKNIRDYRHGAVQTWSQFAFISNFVTDVLGGDSASQ